MTAKVREGVAPPHVNAMPACLARRLLLLNRLKGEQSRVIALYPKSRRELYQVRMVISQCLSKRDANRFGRNDGLHEVFDLSELHPAPAEESGRVNELPKVCWNPRNDQLIEALTLLHRSWLISQLQLIMKLLIPEELTNNLYTDLKKKEKLLKAKTCWQESSIPINRT